MQTVTPPTAGLTNDGPLTCTKVSVTLTATGAGTYAYSGGSATVTMPGTYTVTVTAANGCTATSTTAVVQNTTAPVVTPSADFTTVTCTNPTATLSPNGAGFVWSGGNMVTPMANTTYTVTATGTNGCTTTATIAIVVDKTAPTGGLTNDGPLTCTKLSVTLTGTGGGTYAYGGGSATVTAMGTYTVTVTGMNGCTATAATAVTQNVTLPTANITGVAALTCARTSTTLTASGGGTYAWSAPLISTAAASGAITAAATYTVTVTAANGCTATATKVVTANTTAPIINIAGVTSFCTPGSAVLTASAGYPTYVWSGGGAVRTKTITAGGTYTVTVTATNGCTKSATKVVTTNSLPMVTATSNSPVCAGTTIMLTGTSTATPTATYAWAGPGYASATLSPMRTASTSTMAGVYTLSATNTCGTARASTTVVINPTPAVTITIKNSISGGSTGAAQANVTTTGCTFVWKNAGGTTIGTTNAITNRPAGSYTVVVTPPATMAVPTPCAVTRTITIY